MKKPFQKNARFPLFVDITKQEKWIQAVLKGKSCKDIFWKDKRPDGYYFPLPTCTGEPLGREAEKNGCPKLSVSLFVWIYFFIAKFE